jgi:hypothetical protein
MTAHIPGGTVGLDLSADVRTFFTEVFAEARRAQPVKATTAAERYMIGLLADYARPQTAATEPKPYTFLLEEALKSQSAERFDRLRSLGDRVLYTSGFFRTHLEQRGVEVDYVERVGARAYDAASAMLKSAHLGCDNPGSLDVLHELAEHFKEFAILLNEVADVLLARSAQTPGSLVRVYERWLKSGSGALADALAKRGLVPLKNPGAVH